jgi:hypothetical protein
VKKYLDVAIFIAFMLPAHAIGGSSIFGFGPQLLGSYRYAYSVSALGRGGYEMSFIDSLNVNQMNYALWTKLERTTVSLNFRYAGIYTESNRAHVNSTDASFMGGFLTLPLKLKKIVVGLGLAPRLMNNIGIKLAHIGPDSNIVQKIQSKGNLSEALLIGSFSFIPRISFAFEVGYDFGMITDKNSILFNNSAYSDIIIYDDYQMQGTNFGVNCFYEINDKFNLGLKYKSTTHLSINDERNSSNLPAPIKQTLTADLPSLIACGLDYQVSELWQLGLDFIYQDWARSYRLNDQRVENVKDSYRIGLGFEKSPIERRFIPYFQDLSWRGGMFFGQQNVTVNENPVYEYGITVGISFPIRKHRNRIDIAFEYGQRGNANSTILNERFFGLSFSLSSSEQWFVREKR